MMQTCHHCDYDLAGSPDRGVCPECGRAYDKHSSYRMQQAYEPVLSKHIKWVSLAVFAGLTLMVGGAIAILSDDRVGVLALTLLIAGLSGFGAFAYWQQQRNERRESE
ncbi:MAG: hypothetical protein ACPGYV_03930 [Phycisphaeraceae bacterium]